MPNRATRHYKLVLLKVEHMNLQRTTSNAIEEPISLPTSLTTDLEALSYLASHGDLIL